jgi:hypothetical protein
MDFVKNDSFKDQIDFSNGYFENLQKAFDADKVKSAAYGSINPPKGIFEPTGLYHRHNLDPRGLRHKFYTLTYRILRDIAKKVAPITAVHTLRTMQVRPFSFRAYNDDETGFCVKLKDKNATPSKKERIEMQEIEEFLFHAGFVNFPGADEREEGMQEINEQLTRELYTIDQIAISLRKNRKGKLLDYWMLDGSTIVRTQKDVGYEGDKKIKYVQEIEGRIAETFTNDDLIFYYSNRLTNLDRKGYGFSYIEQCVDIITSWIFGMTYNKEFFNSSSQPKGILTFQGDQLDQGQIEELQRQWVSMFRGVKGMWKTPFLQYDAKWQNLAPSNRDMEFNEYIQILSSWIFAVHGTDAQEVGMRLNQAQNVLNDNQEAKIAFSKSRALRDLLFSIGTIYNKIIEKVPEWNKYMFTFTGLEARDQAAEEDVKTKKVKSTTTLNEIRAEEDKDPLPYGDVVLDPQYIQHVQAMEAMKAGGQPGEEGEAPPENENQEQGKDEDVDFEINESDLEEVQKSSDDEFIEIIL